MPEEAVRLLLIAGGFAAVEWAVLNVGVWCRKSIPWLAAGIVAAMTFVAGLGITFNIPLIIYGGSLLLLLGLLQLPSRGPALYHATSAIAFLAFLLAIWLPLEGIHRQHDQWRQATPFESMEERLPAPKPSAPDGPLSVMWSNLETRMTWDSDRRRELGIRNIHEAEVAVFMQASGFGIARMRLTIHEDHFLPDTTPPVRQPEEYKPLVVSLGDEPGERKHLQELQLQSLLDFVNPKGFGYVKSREQVAGFQPHRFSRVPPRVENWDVRRVELVGLLLHTEPAVYVSDHLPRMDELKAAPTRPLDSFEAEGLRAIRSGQDIFARGDASTTRAFGAIRNVDACVKCHAGKAGDLLGGFSYLLRTPAGQ